MMACTVRLKMLLIHSGTLSALLIASGIVTGIM
jgi:hypothetical protein